jgi:hypothetical protein
MRSWTSKGTLVAVISISALSGVARADDFGCSDATLKGKYAFGVTAYTPPNLPDGPPAVAAGIKVFDGKGNLTQRDYRGDTVPAQFSPASGLHQEKGTYTVASDCTGSMVINLNAPVPVGSTGVIKVLFVISDGGRHIHEVVSEFTPPGSTTGAVPTQTSRRLEGRLRAGRMSVADAH